MLAAIDKLVPGLVLVSGILGFAVIYVCMHFTGLMIGMTALIVFVVSIVVYAKKGSFGDAALSLVAGMFAAFAVNWDPGKFMIFACLWLALALFVLVTATVKLAAQQQQIYTYAAIAAGSNPSGEVESELRTIAANCEVDTLGPVERANVIRLFAFRRVPREIMQASLQSVAMLVAITGVDHMTMASYVVDMTRILPEVPGRTENQVRDEMLNVLQAGGTAPQEFLDAFHQSRRLVLLEEMAPNSYLEALAAATSTGVPPSDMYEHLRKRSA